MVRVLLINPRDNLTLDNDTFPRLGLLLMGTILKQKGYTVKVVHQVADNIINQNDIMLLIRDFKPDIVGVTLTTFQTAWTKVITRIAKEINPNIVTVAGGPHISALKEDSFKYFDSLDQIVIGEAEAVIEGIVTRDVWYKTTTPQLITNLDDLPFPDYSLINIKRFSGPIPVRGLPHMSIIASRGCPFNCSFCCKDVYGHTLRTHSPEYVIEHIKYLKSLGAKEISFEDDSINIDLDWSKRILEGIIRAGLNKGIIYRTGLRANERLIDLEYLKLLKKAGFWQVFYGVESGNQKMLDHMNKKISLDEIRRAFRLAHEVGLKTVSPFIIGLPGETNETIKDSIAFCKELKAFTIGFARALPFPGTAFEKEAREKGWLEKTDYDNFSWLEMRVRTEALTSQELETWVKYCSKLSLRHLISTSITNPWMLPQTIRSMGVKEVLTKVIRNL